MPLSAASACWTACGIRSQMRVWSPTFLIADKHDLVDREAPRKGNDSTVSVAPAQATAAFLVGCGGFHAIRNKLDTLMRVRFAAVTMEDLGDASLLAHDAPL